MDALRRADKVVAALPRPPVALSLSLALCLLIRSAGASSGLLESSYFLRSSASPLRPQAPQGRASARERPLAETKRTRAPGRVCHPFNAIVCESAHVVWKRLRCVAWPCVRVCFHRPSSDEHSQRAKRLFNSPFCPVHSY